jgi:hypothetical protein
MAERNWFDPEYVAQRKAEAEAKAAKEAAVQNAVKKFFVAAFKKEQVQNA